MGDTHENSDLACIVNRAAQLSEKTFKVAKVRELKKGVNQARRYKPNALNFEPVDLDSIHFRVYSDAAFATNDDLSSQLGYLVMLADKSGKFHLLEYSSNKSKRVIRSIMGGETYAFMDALDATFAVKQDVEYIMGRKLDIHMFTDSKRLFDAITRGKRTMEKRFSVDIAAPRTAYKRLFCVLNHRLSRMGTETRRGRHYQIYQFFINSKAHN